MKHKCKCHMCKELKNLHLKKDSFDLGLIVYICEDCDKPLTITITPYTKGDE